MIWDVSEMIWDVSELVWFLVKWFEGEMNIYYLGNRV